MQRGLLWGIGRLAHVRPHLMQNAVQHLLPYLDSPDATVRGLAAWVTGLLGVEMARSKLQRLKTDETRIQIYKDHKVIHCRVMDLAEEALSAIRGSTEEL